MNMIGTASIRTVVTAAVFCLAATAAAQDAAVTAGDATSPFGLAALPSDSLAGQRGGTDGGTTLLPPDGNGMVAGYGANTVGAGTANNASGHLTTIQNAANNAVILSTTNIIVE